MSLLARDYVLSPPLTGVFLSALPTALTVDIVPEKYRHLWLSREQNEDAPILNEPLYRFIQGKSLRTSTFFKAMTTNAKSAQMIATNQTTAHFSPLPWLTPTATVACLVHISSSVAWIRFETGRLFTRRFSGRIAASRQQWMFSQDSRTAGGPSFLNCRPQVTITLELETLLTGYYGRRIRLVARLLSIWFER